jgi:uncharacterized protein YerC
MTHVSRRKLDSQVLKQIAYFLRAIVADLKTEQEVAVFLEALLTKTEKLMLGKRLAMVVLLSEGVPESQICETLKTTYSTVERTKLLLDKTMTGYQVGLKKLKKRQNWQMIKDLLFKLAKYTANPYRSVMFKPSR